MGKRDGLDVVHDGPIGVDVRNALGHDGFGIGVYLVHLMGNHGIVSIEGDGVARLERVGIDGRHIDQRAHWVHRFHRARKHHVGHVAKSDGMVKRAVRINEIPINNQVIVFINRAIEPNFHSQTAGK